MDVRLLCVMKFLRDKRGRHAEGKQGRAKSLHAPAGGRRRASSSNARCIKRGAHYAPGRFARRAKGLFKRSTAESGTLNSRRRDNCVRRYCWRAAPETKASSFHEAIRGRATEGES